MSYIIRMIDDHLSPAMRDVVHGVTLGYDPTPRSYEDTFIDSDIGAFIADSEALFLDWCCVYRDRIERLDEEHGAGGHHYGRSHTSGWRQPE
jgi:hypothetical protein